MGNGFQSLLPKAPGLYLFLVLSPLPFVLKKRSLGHRALSPHFDGLLHIKQDRIEVRDQIGPLRILFSSFVPSQWERGTCQAVLGQVKMRRPDGRRERNLGPGSGKGKLGV